MKKKKSVEVQKTRVDSSCNGMEKKEKLFREVTMKIRLKQKDNKEEIVVKVLLDSTTKELVMSLKFARKN